MCGHESFKKSKLLAVVNPVSGRGRAKAAWPLLEKALIELGIEYSVEWTQHPGHATDLASHA
ncbi:MAG: acylglycerol kinase family protein, partial [Bacillota bacterium]